LPDEATGMGVVPVGNGTVPVREGHGAVFAPSRAAAKGIAFE